MSDEANQKRLAQFEQAVTTLFTCRSVVRHFTTLGDAQQQELIAEINSALQFLRSFLVVPAAETTEQAASPQPQQPESGTLTVREESSEYTHSEQYTLESLYRMYHTFLGDGPSSVINTLVARFGDVMSLLTETENAMTAISDGVIYADAHPPAAQGSLERVRSFIVDLYYVFLEFLRAVSGVLQAHEIHINTEELYPLVGREAAQAEEHSRPDLRPMADVYEKHQQINERRGALSRRISNATVLLEFLEERLAVGRDRSDETAAQINETAQLLRDLWCLLSGYENAAFLLLHHTW
jgi:hypothetical protein